MANWNPFTWGGNKVLDKKGYQGVVPGQDTTMATMNNQFNQAKVPPTITPDIPTNTVVNQTTGEAASNTLQGDSYDDQGNLISFADKKILDEKKSLQLDGEDAENQKIEEDSLLNRAMGGEDPNAVLDIQGRGKKGREGPIGFQNIGSGTGMFGKPGGFMSKFGTGEGALGGLGNIGSAKFGENEFFEDAEGEVTDALDPSYGKMLDKGQGLFGKEGGFMSKFGTGKGFMSKMLGGDKGEGGEGGPTQSPIDVGDAYQYKSIF